MFHIASMFEMSFTYLKDVSRRAHSGEVHNRLVSFWNFHTKAEPENAFREHSPPRRMPE